MDQSTDHVDDESIDRVLHTFFQPDSGAPLIKRVNDINIIDFSNPNQLFVSMPPHRRLLLMVLLLALKDQASEVRFESWVSEPEGYGIRLFYEVDGQLHELVPPPHDIAKAVMREIKTVAGFYSMRHRLANVFRRLASKLDAQPRQPAQSLFQIKEGDDKIDVLTTIYDSEMGDRVFLRLSDCPRSLAEKAQSAMNAILINKHQASA